MKKKIFTCLLASVVLSTCSKQDDKLLLSGTFTEEVPFKGSAQLTFKGRYMILSSPVSAYADTFTYSLSPGKINLKYLHSNEVSQRLFEYVDQNSFWIGNIFVTVPELTITKALFKR